MPIVRIISPDEITYEMYQQVSDKLNAEGDPPDGLIVHTASVVDGKLKIVDVWESEEAAERFGEQRLGPTIEEIAGPDAAGPPRPDQVQIYEVKSLVKP